MSDYQICVLNEDPKLREKSRDVKKEENLTNLVNAMKDALAGYDGIGIAAPQMGKPLRVFIVAKNLFPPEVRGKISSDVFINPKFVKRSFKRAEMEEGCLSVPQVFGMVRRPVRVIIEAYDQNWKKFRVAADGLLARVFQHEVDHLDGVLYVDRATPKTLHKIMPGGSTRPWELNEHDKNPRA